jgi:hypothetical protein
MLKYLRQLSARTPGRSAVKGLLIGGAFGATGPAQVVNGDFSLPTITKSLEMIAQDEIASW